MAGEESHHIIDQQMNGSEPRWPHCLRFACRDESDIQAFDVAFNYDADALGLWIAAQLKRQERLCWATHEPFDQHPYLQSLDSPVVYRIDRTDQAVPRQYVIVRQRAARLMEKCGVAYFDHCRFGVPGYPDLKAYLRFGRGLGMPGIRYCIVDDELGIESNDIGGVPGTPTFLRIYRHEKMAFDERVSERWREVNKRLLAALSWKGRKFRENLLSEFDDYQRQKEKTDQVLASRFTGVEWDVALKLEKGKQPGARSAGGIKRLLIRGYIAMDKDGLYHLTEAGRDALANSKTI